ncbi:MAG: Gfo/Idh/MocA family oxidoreductase [Caldilineaceae bacterium]
MQPTRLGVIGLGLIWQRAHQPVLAQMTDLIQPVAFCDLSAERRAATAAAYPNAQVVEDYQTLLANPAVDVVLVLTPIALNAPTALAALKAGKDVIMEKPVARSLAEGDALIAQARTLGRRIMVTEQMAYRHAETQLAELLAGGAIGDLILWERVQHLEADTAQGAMRYDTTPWRKAANFPLGTLFDGGIHIIAGLTKVFGAPATVAATGRRLRQEYGDYDQVAMFFHYASGLTGMLSHSSYLPAIKNYFYIHGTQGVITVEPTRLLIDKPGQVTQVIDMPAINAYAGMWQAILTAYQAGSEPYYTPEKALGDVAILLAVEEAIKQGAIVTVRQ